MGAPIFHAKTVGTIRRMGNEVALVFPAEFLHAEHGSTCSVGISTTGIRATGIKSAQSLFDMKGAVVADEDASVRHLKVAYLPTPRRGHSLIYGLSDPRRPERIAYVGLTTCSMRERLALHRSSGLGVGKWLRWMADGGAGGPAVTVLDEVPNAKASQVEYDWIRRLGGKTNLLNDVGPGSFYPAFGFKELVVESTSQRQSLPNAVGAT